MLLSLFVRLALGPKGTALNPWKDWELLGLLVELGRRAFSTGYLVALTNGVRDSKLTEVSFTGTLEAGGGA